MSRFSPYKLNMIHAFIMLLLTSAYLSVEAPFGKYLPVFMAGTSTTSEMDYVQSFGRIMTGLAIAIFVLGLMLPRFAYRRKTIPYQIGVSALVSAVVVLATYIALDLYAENTADNASNADLRSAYVAMLARGHVAQTGIGDIVPNNDDAAWRAFLSTAAVTMRPEALVSATNLSLPDLATSEALKIIGTSADLRKTFFGHSFDEAFKSYNEYVDGSNLYNKKMANITKDGMAEFDTYYKDLKAQHPEGIPLRGWTTAGIRSKVMERLPVDSNWNIVDENGWMIAYNKVAAPQIKKAYADKINEVLGGEGFIEPGQSYDGFLANPVIQKRVRQAIRAKTGLTFGDGVISPNMSDAAFDAIVYRPALDKTRSDFLKMVSSDTSFNDADIAIKGRLAYQAATIPAMVILLSLFGAALHIFKFTTYAVQFYGLLRGNLRYAFGYRRFAIGGGVLATTLAAALLWGNNVTSTTTFHTMSKSGLYETVISEAIAVQPAFAFFGTTASKIGIWGVVSADLPTPHPIATTLAAKRPTNTTAAVPAKTEMTAAIIPVPTPRPTEGS